MDYSQLSDFEINKLVAKATGTQVEETYQFVNGGEDISDHMSGIVLMQKITSNRKHWKLYDPCNNPSDAWPIISSNKINIEFEGDVVDGKEEWWAIASWGRTAEEHQFCTDDNPHRAAMIFFLMTREAKHA